MLPDLDLLCLQKHQKASLCSSTLLLLIQAAKTLARLCEFLRPARLGLRYSYEVSKSHELAKLHVCTSLA